MPRGMASTAGGQWRHLLSWGQAAGGAGWGAFLLAMWGMGLALLGQVRLY